MLCCATNIMIIIITSKVVFTVKVKMHPCEIFLDSHTCMELPNVGVCAYDDVCVCVYVCVCLCVCVCALLFSLVSI